ncbi:cytochrome P450 [Coniophora puteana RWD-64-598 SS2]|uniref:Cytochrome P450 n=1 Tax=Coniophora puteana (strain RWD-64-598) TaxID=741705 RepID=A0A5M3MFC5_CONPW|nr:cytochrome P450 [Coniophora puteana RWD-64-598 SS2]EIW77912.1 cytochrome P450 [Coniophora puteana RWD-64-598 SS2]
MESLLPTQLPTKLQDVDPNVLGLAVVSLSACALAWKSYSSRTSRPMPPSPPTNHWFYGHKVTRNLPFLQIEEWIKEYGPIITLRDGTEKYVVIGGQQALFDIMERQGGLLADRPHRISITELLTGGVSIGFANGSRLRLMRRAMHTHLQPKAVGTYAPLQMEHVRGTIIGLLDEPMKYQSHARAYAASVVLKVAYGKNTPTSASDPEVQEIERNMTMTRKALRPGAYLVDYAPLSWLKYIPWYGSELKRTHESNAKVFVEHLENVRNKLNDGDAGPSFSKHLFENESSYGMTRKEMAFLAGSFFSAGSETSAIGACQIMMSAALHPEIQARIQAEIDAVVGHDRAPTFDDENSLPLIRAFVQEVHRWRPIAAMGLSHYTTDDVLWNGYCIPKGTAVWGNQWTASRDPDFWTDANKFDINRWLTEDGAFRADLNDMRHLAFGFGRRICPGQHLAQRSLLINAIVILWAFRISLDPTKYSKDALRLLAESPEIDSFAYMRGVPTNKPAFSYVFEPRIEPDRLREMMKDYPYA